MPIKGAGSDPTIMFGGQEQNRAPIWVLNGPNDTTPILGYSLGVRSPQSATAVSKFTWVTRDNDPNASAFHRAEVMSDDDRWIFDYRNHALTGSLNRQYKSFDALNLALEQTFLDKRAGIEIAYDEQRDKSGWTDQASNNLQVDTSGFLPYTIYNPVTKVNDAVPNPNAGRLFLNYRSWLSDTVTDRTSWRVTSFYDLDFTRESKSLRWLGRHVFTGMLSNQQATTRRANTQYGDAIGLDNKAIIDANTGPQANFLATSFDRSVIGIRYLGAITGPGASSVAVPANTPKLINYPAIMWNRNAIPNLPGEVGAWQTRTISVIDNPVSLAQQRLDRFTGADQPKLSPQ
jgi:hypothetical protein